MSDKTDEEGTESENKLIKEMRAEVKAAKAEAKSAASDARKEIVREAEAINLLGDQFKGLAPYLTQEVEGELTKESVAEWLTGRGLAVSSDADDDNSDKDDADKADPAAALESVTNLGSKVTATATTTPDQKLDASIGEAADEFGQIGDLPALTAKLAGLLAE